MNKLGIGTILAITGITLMIAGLIILPNAENSLAGVERQVLTKQFVSLSTSASPNLVIAAEKNVGSTSSIHSVDAVYSIETSSCSDGDFFQKGEFVWSMKKAKLNFNSQCGFVDITVEATSTPVTTETLRDCSSSSFFRHFVVTSVDATFSGTVGGISVSGDDAAIGRTSSIIHSCP